MEPGKAVKKGLPAHAMTCDVEDYFQVSAFNDHVSRSDWEKFECRIPRNIDLILSRFNDTDTKATFFTLGWVAQKYPEVVRRIADAGHEIASHGMQHKRVWQQSRDEFYNDVVSSRKLLEDVAGQSVVGYRAASWSIDGRTPWAYDVLAEAGYRYSSSIYPISHDHFGDPNAPTGPHAVCDGDLIEIPASVASVFGRNIPAAGGGYFRLFPFWFSKLLIRRIEASGERPYVFYFHPWEIDPDQPRIKNIPAKARFRHYVNLGKFESRLSQMLQEFDWDRMDRIFLDSV
jgi:polysaccharide deacetylase family protein (PEP-CTERM system associated)